jgi:hypothetical protein
MIRKDYMSMLKEAYKKRKSESADQGDEQQ